MNVLACFESFEYAQNEEHKNLNNDFKCGPNQQSRLISKALKHLIRELEQKEVKEMPVHKRLYPDIDLLPKN